MGIGNRRRARGVIGVAMSDENEAEHRSALVKGRVQRGQMMRVADSSIDERGFPVGTDEQIRIVPRAGHRTRIPRLEQDRGHHEFDCVNRFKKLSTLPAGT